MNADAMWRSRGLQPSCPPPIGGVERAGGGTEHQDRRGGVNRKCGVRSFKRTACTLSLINVSPLTERAVMIFFCGCCCAATCAIDEELFSWIDTC